jgi:microcystin-dependent protein
MAATGRPGLSNYFQGQFGGAATVTLLQSQIPAHLHQVKASTSGGTQTDPNGMTWATGSASRGLKMYTSTPQPTQMNPLAFAASGDGQPHNNMMPYLALTFIIALVGIYPTRP